MKNKYLIYYLVILLFSAFTCSCDFSDKSLETTIVNSPGVSSNPDAKINPRTSQFEEIASNHLKSLGSNKSSSAISDILNKIDNYNSTIQKVSNDLGVNKNLITSIIFREQLLIGLDDELADSIVDSFYKKNYINGQINVTASSGEKDDSSTGLGQIFARTAIGAEISINKNNKLSPSNLRDVHDMWYKLQNDETNIYYIALVLKYKAASLNINTNSTNLDSIQKLFERYNGAGDKAITYGSQTLEYYKLFEKN